MTLLSPRIANNKSVIMACQKSKWKSCLRILFACWLMLESCSSLQAQQSTNSMTCSMVSRRSIVGVKKFLGSPFNLRPNYEKGDEDFYRIRTRYLEMNDSGEVALTRIIEGYYSRKIDRIASDKRYDRFIWKYVRMGQRPGKGEVTQYKILPYATNFAYELSYEEVAASHRFSFDYSSLPRTMEAWYFVVLLMDAHTFDLVTRVEDYLGRMECVGDSSFLPVEDIPIPIDFPPLFTHSEFVNSAVRINFKGITLHHNELCAIVSFRSDASKVHMVANLMGTGMPIEGTSYYWGEVLFSLEARRVVRGQIIERVDSVYRLGSGSPIRQAIRREIILERIRKEAFNLVKG